MIFSRTPLPIDADASLRQLFRNTPLLVPFTDGLAAVGEDSGDTAEEREQQPHDLQISGNIRQCTYLLFYNIRPVAGMLLIFMFIIYERCSDICYYIDARIGCQ